MNKTIKYITFYDVECNLENREYYQSAKNKNNYICQVLEKNNYNVKLISPSWTNNEKGFYKKRNEQISKHIELKLFSTFGAKNRLLRIIKYLWSLFQVFIYLLVNIKKDEVVIVYHTPLIAIIMILLKKIKKFNLVLELEEKYQDVFKISRILKKAEDYIINEADAYILATEMFINITNNKPYAICNGMYKVSKQYKQSFNDNKIHLVYSGIINKSKGAFKAAELAIHLNEEYAIHILGFGDEKDIQELRQFIEKINTTACCKVYLDGLLTGEEYIKFLQKCQVGLSLQNIEAKYNNTSFPSKILTYLSNGLRVVSVNIPAIEKSRIAHLIYFYDEDNLRNIAETIKKINFNDNYESRKTIESLDEAFIIKLKELLERDIKKNERKNKGKNKENKKTIIK